MDIHTGFREKFRKQTGGEINTMEDKRLFSTYQGVFRPTILTLLGIIPYLREGWVVGHAGLFGAISIIIFAFAITGSTALSMSSIVTNSRIGAGGVFSLVSHSLGLQIGGSMGVPLYLAQGLATALFLFGFSEGWLYIFPEHEKLLVLLIAFAGTAAISLLGTRFIFRVQVVVMFVVIAALLSILLGPFRLGIIEENPILWQDFSNSASSGLGYWAIFAVFFPGVSGILVGSSMSANLKNPRVSIPRGTLAAWATACVVYILFACWYAFMGSSQELQTNFTLSVDRALFPELVLLGILAACFIAALSSLAAAPRVLQALGSYNIVPFSNFFCKLNRGEPRNATLFTLLLTLFILLIFGDVNAIAPFVTQFFIIIYFIINTVLAIEQQLNLVSFRPELRIPKFVPIVGSLLSLFAMFVISAIAGFLSLTFVIMLYSYLGLKKVSTPWETVQSGLFVSIAENFARRAERSGGIQNKRIWKPDLLVLLLEAKSVQGLSNLLSGLVKPQGSLCLMVLNEDRQSHEKEEKDKTVSRGMLRRFRRRGVPVLISQSPAKNLGEYACLVLSFLESRLALFSPNGLFICLEDISQHWLQRITKASLEAKISLIFLAKPKLKGRRQLLLKKYTGLILWIRDQSPSWEFSLQLSNVDFSALLAYKLKENLQLPLTLACVVQSDLAAQQAKQYLHEFMLIARLGKHVSVQVEKTSLTKHIAEQKSGALHIFGLGSSVTVSKKTMQNFNTLSQGTCLFVHDSGAGHESILV